MNAEANPSPALVHPIVGPRLFVLVNEPDYEPSHVIAVYADAAAAQMEAQRMRRECEEYEIEQRELEEDGLDAWIEPYPAPMFPAVREVPFIPKRPNAGDQGARPTDASKAPGVEDPRSPASTC